MKSPSPNRISIKHVKYYYVIQSQKNSQSGDIIDSWLHHNNIELFIFRYLMST